VPDGCRFDAGDQLRGVDDLDTRLTATAPRIAHAYARPEKFHVYQEAPPEIAHKIAEARKKELEEAKKD